MLNIGFNRSGTTSLHEALQSLGLNAVHSVSVNSDLVRDVLSFGKSGLLDRYEAFTEAYPLCDYWDALVRALPRAKFLFTVRPVEGWIRSRLAHVLVNRMGLADPNWVDIDTWHDAEWHQSHCEEVRAYFQGKSNFLEMDVTAGDGWDRLCPFLGLESPGTPFPRRHGSRSLLAKLRDVIDPPTP